MQLTHKPSAPEEAITQKDNNFRYFLSFGKLKNACNMCLQCIIHVSHFLFELIYNIIPRDRLGLGINYQRLNNFNALEEYDQLTQDHIDQFHIKMEKFFNPENKENVLQLFKENLKNPISSVPISFGRLYSMSVEKPIPGITSEEKVIIKMLHNKYVENIGNKSYSEVSVKNLSLKDVKLYYNVCVKCMNYAMCHEDTQAVTALCYSFKAFQEHDRFSTLQTCHLEHLRGNKDFIELLQVLKSHLKYGLDDNGNQDPSFVIHSLIEHFIHEKPENSCKVEYRGMFNLILLADDAFRKINKGKSALERDLLILDVARRLGILNIAILNKINKAMREFFGLSEKDLKVMLLTNNIDINQLKFCVEKFLTITHKATKFIDIPFFELFNEKLKKDAYIPQVLT